MEPKANDSASNRVQSGESLNYDGENYDELHAGVDPLVEHIYTLQSAQEALGKEVLKFREVGILLDVSVDGAVQDSPSELISIDLKLQDTSSSKQIQSDKNMHSSFYSLHSEAIEAVNRKYMGTELEDLFRLKIEAEVEYLAISRTTQKYRGAVKDKISLASEQFLKLNRLENTKNKASMLEKEAEKLVNSCEDIASAEKTLKLQMRLCKYASYFLIQLVILLLILGFFIFDISPNYDGVVPT
ncbi:WPP domain-interacting protein 1-like isoform X2 [Olea europaea var. sylvestris]|uniref:WPP domain-interacting protein 1-like isoform X2 n=1 Tax=Olea europaea var. sylvestris TaxID=158386 RepID=UPI000C1D88C7|nr:WPP domain-interacting protein 1-like isoform X2 [Olea europaea var. sylvestris]